MVAQDPVYRYQAGYSSDIDQGCAANPRLRPLINNGTVHCAKDRTFPFLSLTLTLNPVPTSSTVLSLVQVFEKNGIDAFLAEVTLESDKLKLFLAVPGIVGIILTYAGSLSSRHRQEYHLNGLI